ncbi:Rieske 2Fe-2S domain-containing protein [Nonomuraea sp. NPDC001023]|uniref:Rieske 2Fe-2S domain-containing protein n=1 Tax=unclassified Nonomuraea TaxID=2593643 RepID=UPI00331D309F
MDKPIRGLAKVVRERLRQGTLRDLLHGVPTGKPLHPPLATVTLGCWLSAAVLDLAHADPRASRLLLATGIANALPTAAAGLTDWSSLHREQQRVGFVHMAANMTALGLMSASLVARLRGAERAGRVLSYVGLGLGGLGGYLGGHMAYRQAAGANHAPQVAHLVPLGWHDLCPLKDLPDGRPVARRLGYIQLFVLRQGDGVTVLADRCPHLAGPLHQGRLVMEDGEACVVCPWHSSTFRLADGSVKHGPATAPAPMFETRIRRDGTIQVRPGLT